MPFVIQKKNKKNVFTFGGWCYYAFTLTVSYVITRERWFRVYFLHAENFFRPNPTWCILRRGLKTIWGNFQTAANDSYFWKKRNDWVSYKTTTTNLNRNHMAYPTLFHAVSRSGLLSLLNCLFLNVCCCHIPLFTCL